MLSRVIGAGSSKVAPSGAEEDASKTSAGSLGLVAAAGQAAAQTAGVVTSSVLPVASSAAGAASHIAGASASAAVTAAGAAKHVAEGAAHEAMDKAGSLAAMSKEKMQDIIRKLREYLETWVKKKVQAYTEKAVDRLPGLAKHMLEDPEMPRCVSRGKDRMIDNMWPDIREEILWEVAVLLDGQAGKNEETEEQCVDCFRAFFRYHIFPYDKGFWGQLQDPVRLVLRIISLMPVYGVSPLLFFFIFTIIDKSDEFQLINFILSFKGTQFITMGIIRCCVGFAMFMMCVPAKGGTEHDCKDNGPGNRNDMLATSVGFFLQVVLVWVAFLMLRCSVEKGRTQLQGRIDFEHGGRSHVKGGYIQYFLWYDLFFFLFALILPMYVLLTRKNITHDDWVLAQTVYAAQIIYGLLSAPFFIFTLPGLQRILTHAMPTAYDPQGRCRKCIKASPPTSQAEKEKEAFVSEEDSTGIFNKMRELIGVF